MSATSQFVRCSGAVAICLLIGCSGREDQSQPADDGEAVEIYVVNYPLKYFADRIVGDKLTVVFPAPPNGDPAYWSPDERAIAAYQNAGLILLNGASYAKWVPKVTLPESKLVNTSAGFKDKYIVSEDAITHSHGPAGEHEHGTTDFNTWLDPELAIMHAEAVAEAVGELMPEHNEAFQQNLASLRKDLEDLDAALSAVTAGYDGRPLLASHPVYSYLARHCGWNLKSMHWEPDEMPDDEQWAKLDTLLAEHPAQWMIWEDEPDAAIVEKLLERDIHVTVFAPCGNVPASGDYLQVMRANVANLKPVFESLPADGDDGPDS
jgi:zinc transport system substrate-binding protein